MIPLGVLERKNSSSPCGSTFRRLVVAGWLATSTTGKPDERLSASVGCRSEKQTCHVMSGAKEGDVAALHTKAAATSRLTLVIRLDLKYRLIKIKYLMVVYIFRRYVAAG